MQFPSVKNLHGISWVIPRAWKVWKVACKEGRKFSIHCTPRGWMSSHALNGGTTYAAASTPTVTPAAATTTVFAPNQLNIFARTRAYKHKLHLHRSPAGWYSKHCRRLWQNRCCTCPISNASSLPQDPRLNIWRPIFLGAQKWIPSKRHDLLSQPEPAQARVSVCVNHHMSMTSQLGTTTCGRRSAWILASRNEACSS